MLLIDPQQSSDKVNAMVNLEDIEQLEHKGLNAEAFWVALDGKLKQSRAKFKEKIKLLASDYKGEDITVDIQVTIRTTINGICECAQWQVVNYFVGNSASSDFKRLILDEDLGYSPYVGVASPLNEAKTRFEGHVFCFLPLPREGSRLTGLPVHVNGFFALSQNRHHLKWETDEQKGKKIDDKNILWNKYLIKEALPRAYSRLIQCVVDVSNTLDKKETFLTYLCSDGRYYQKVEGLELLPLASGGWTSYKSQRDVVYMCTDEEIEILKGLEKIMVMKPSSLGTPLSHHLDQICSNDLFQIKKLTASDMRQLLETTITNQLGTNPRITQNSKLSFAWLHHTWKYIIEKNYVSHVKNVHIVPVLTTGTWVSPESVDLILLSNMLLVRLSNKDELPEGLCRCFENMGVKVIGSLPEWVPREKVKAHFFWPSQKSIIALLTKLGTTESAEETTEIFNARCKWQDKCVLTACLAKCHHILTEEAIEFLTTLTIFRAISTIEDTGTDTALSNTSCYINVKEQFPEGVHFQNPCIAADSSKEALLSTLGARKLELDELVLATLNGFQTEGGQNANEIPKFMDYLINKFHLFQTNPQIINSASNIPFLRAGNKRCKASDLFDPSDCRLQHLLIGDALLPETKKRLSNEKVRNS
ncbi:uncharacterized protein LOC128557994 [Mercenaria mercenaria]|uniref:uncharacterized protein LOC128557994 n=1 Tax=Mercenaria mercenaria TaxID=6596 RepID=UPI00234EA461|nr:uncharacterized protein LOC128557994 [Mercenaria mercenaria]